LPYDKPGFGVDTTKPAMALLPVNKFTYAGFYADHATHTPGRLPQIAFDRLRVLARDEWKGPRLLLVPFVVVGLFAMNAATAFALACSAALFVGYLSYGHWAEWTIYYFEGIVPISFLAALGLWRSIGWFFAKRPSVEPEMRARRFTRTAALVALVLLALTAYELRAWRASRVRMAAYDRSFQEMLTKLPMHGPHANIAGNSASLASDAVWVVNDLGARDSSLMRFAGTRVPLIFHEDGGDLQIDRSLLPAIVP
jgi:hypothetical protein